LNSLWNSSRARAKHSALVGVIAAALMIFTAVPRAHADDQFTKCRHDADKAEAKLDQAIAKHGGHSEEATEAREHLRKQREHCYERIHQWWDARKQKWEHDDDFGKDLHHHHDDDDNGSR